MMLTIHSLLDLLLEVTRLHGYEAKPQLTTIRPHCDRFWRNRSAWPLHCEQTRYGHPIENSYGQLLMNITARQGCTVVVPFREEMTKRHLKVTGDLGRIVFIVSNTLSTGAEGRLIHY